MVNKAELSKGAKTISWIAQVVAAAVLFQTLFFKFTGAEESKFIFSALGMEPVGRIGSGVVELIAVVLLLIPALCWAGALLGLGSMSGAILFHVTILGVEVMHDGGQLFYLAILVWVCSAVVLYIRRADIPIVGPMLS